MKINRLVLALTCAALLTPIAGEAAETYSCRSTIRNPCPDSYGQVGKLTQSEAQVPNTSYKSVQWIGTILECPSNEGETCYWTISKTQQIATQWKVGIKGAATFNLVGKSLTAEISGEWNKTVTDSEVITTTPSAKPGYSVILYTYVPRAQYTRNYFGVWMKGPKRKCGLANCYTYTFDPNALAARYNYTRATSSQQTFTFKTYKNGTSPGVTKENDD
jgi:hypothetical protein